MSIARPTHKWRRFWRKPEESYSEGDAGFLIDPETEHGKYFQPHAVAIEALRELPCLVLLGEPGMGKSTALAQERSSLAASGSLTVFVELLREPTAARIKEVLNEASDFAKWKAGGGLLHLFLDALDEGLIRNPNLAKEIGSLSAALDVSRLRLRITCRTLEWPSGMEQTLATSWRNVTKYELLPLRRLDVAAAATDLGIDPDAFVREVIARDAQPLATRPISLRFLLQTFVIDGRLPESKLRLYDEGCRLLCSDEGTWERGRPTPDAFRRMAIAARIAAAMTFTNRQIITRPGATSNEAIATSALIGGVEKAHGASYDVDEPAIADALQGSALFSARSTDTFGWAHQSYREFLAAWYLAHRELDATLVESFYFQQHGPVPAPLREVAAWHATLVPAIFDMMLIRDPDVLMMSDTAAVSAPVRRAFVNALLARMDEFQAHDRNYNYDHYHRLEHPGLADQLRPYLLGRNKNVIVRRAAVDIAGACRVEGLMPDLISLLRDGSEIQQVRKAAANALRSFDSDDARQVLKAALSGQLEPDPDDEILGMALRSLWPNHINASTLFEALHMPKRSNFHGAYDSFLYELPKSIGRDELVPALAWASITVDDFEFEYGWASRLRDHIVAVALVHLEDKEIARSVARLAISTFARHHDLFGRRTRRTDPTETREALTSDRRQLLIDTLFAEGAYDERLPACLIYNDPPLLLRSDLEWLVGHATSDGSGPHELAFAEFTKHLIMRFDYPNQAAEADQLAQAFDQSPVFRNALAPLFEVVEIGSQRAGELRATWDAAEKNRRRLEQQARDDKTESAVELNARLTTVRKTLKEVQTREASWPQLYFTMTKGGFKPVAKTDTWPLLDAAEQAHVVEAARSFLEISADPNQDWLDTTSTPGLAFAAEAALCLLATTSALEALSDDAWRRWVHVLVGLVHDRGVVRERLVPAALTRCLPEFVSSLIRVIRRDNRVHGFVTALDMIPLPMPVELQRALIATLPELTDRSWRSVIAALIASGNNDAMAIAVVALENERATRAAVAAHAALPHHPDRWSTVMIRMQHDRNFAVEFMNAFVDADHEPISDAVRVLDEMHAAELFLTLLRLFPPEEDPERNQIEMTVLTSRDQIARMRDRIARALVDNGSISALQWLLEQEPEREFLRWMMVDARSKSSDTTWKPIELDEFLERTGVSLTVITETADRITILFALPLATPAQAVQSLQMVLPDSKVKAGESALFVTRSDQAARTLVEMAQRDVLRIPGNRLIGIRSGSEWFFEAVPPIKLREVKQRDANPDEVRRLLEKVDVLLMTATPRETDAVLSAMRPLSGESDLVIGTLSVDSYTVGQLGNYAVAHCQSGMGSTAADGSLATTCDAIREVRPKAIFLVGIAFGVKRLDHRIGDVLVAKHIRPYGMYKAKPETIEDRGYPIPASVQLMKWMQDRTREWRFLRADGSSARIISPGEVLSGEVLVNNIEFRNWLTDRFSTAIGGEMEGIGAYAANNRYGSSHMLLVKAICDWADGCKNDSAQPFAAAAAVSAVEHLLSRPHILAPIGIDMVT